MSNGLGTSWNDKPAFIGVKSTDLDYYSVGYTEGLVTSMILVLPSTRSWRRGVLRFLYIGQHVRVHVDDTLRFIGRISGIEEQALSVSGHLISKEETLWET